MTGHIISQFRQKFLIALFGLFIVCIYFSAFVYRSNNSQNKVSQNKVDCYKISSVAGAIAYFEDIHEAKRQPTPGKTIFFHETSCSMTGVVQLNAK